MNSEIEKRIDEKLDQASIYNPSERRVVKKKIEFLLKQNENVLDTVDVRLLTSQFDDLSNLLSMLTVYPEIQDNIYSLSIPKYKLFAIIIKTMDERDADWISVAEDFLQSILSGKYNDLFFDPQIKKRINELYDKKSLTSDDFSEIEQITGLLTNMNLFNISSYRELRHINLNKKYNDLLIGKIKNPYFSSLSNIDKLRHVILSKKFGHGLDVANIFLERYASDYEEIVKIIDSEDDHNIHKYVVDTRKITDPEKITREVERIRKENQAVKQYLTALKTITETRDIEKLKQYYAAIQDVSAVNHSYYMDSVIRKFFCRQKNKELYQVKQEDRVRIDGTDVYMIQDDFKLSITSLQSYANSLDWDVKLLNNHGICTCMMANNNMGHAPIMGACLGFTDYDERSLYVSSPWDIASNRFADHMNISKAKTRANQFGEADIKFYTPNSQINMTRRRHNEDLYERRELDLDKIDYDNEKFKKQPSYVVYFSETSLSNFLNGGDKETLTSENLRKYLDFNKLNDVSYRTWLVENYAKNDYCWEASKQEARKRNVDIVVVDRTYVALKERLKIDQLENDILNYDINKLNSSNEDMGNFLNMIEKMIVESENNRAGNSIRNSADGSNKGKLVHEEIREKLFSTDIMNDRLRKIESKIRMLDPDKQKECYEKLIQITRSEIEKYEHAYFEKDPGYDLNGYLLHWLQEKNGNSKIDMQSLLQEVDPATGKCGGDIVCEAIGDIKELDEYDSSSAVIHGQKHINNVILFSYLIGKGERKLDSESMDLLIQAAKFHDVGRDGNWNGLGNGNREDENKVPHAEPSALAAEFYLKKEHDGNGNRKYTDEQIAIVKTAIIYHEVHERFHNQFNEEIFEELCKKNGIKPQDRERAKLISIYLKDADAVDRTRFMQDYEEDILTIPEHRRYERRFYDQLDISYLRTNSSLLLVEEARKIHREFLKKGCEHVFDASGRVVNSSPETTLPDILSPYEHVINNRRIKYKESDNIEKIRQFLEAKRNEEQNQEIGDLMDCCNLADKTLLAKLRRFGRTVLQKLRIIEPNREVGL